MRVGSELSWRCVVHACVTTRRDIAIGDYISGMSDREETIMKKIRMIMGSGIALVLCLGLCMISPPASADPDGVSFQERLDAIASEIEEASDQILVEGNTSAVATRASTADRGALADYFDTLRMEQRSIAEYGGVTVLDTTAEIEVLSAGAAQSQVLGELHVTRTVAELPDGELWEEVLPLTLEMNHDGSLAVTKVDTQEPVETEPAPAGKPESTQAEEIETPATYDPAAYTGVTTMRASKINRTKAITYAKKWWNKKNTAYPTRYKNDCTNFVSQVMHQGGWQPVPGWYKSNKAWWYKGIPNGSYTWGGAENFYRFAVHESKRAKSLKNVADLWLADILQYKTKGKSAMSHTMVVTNWVNKVPYLTYHTRNTLNKPFTAMVGMKVTWFASHT